ncbi:MAG: hypothetical protein ACJAS1_000482 [Oleiphilaceae bacterium]|jgi:hypothetical protein
MIEIREWILVIIFFSGIAGIYTLFVDAFECSILFAAVLFFTLAYIIWPSKLKGQRDDESRMSDIFETLIEFSIDLCLRILKLFRRLFGGKGDGIDFDFDI